MKTIFTFLLLAVFSLGVNAQWVSTTFEEAGNSGGEWNQFANAGDDPANMVVVENPDKTGINASDSVLMFNVLAGADPWVGAWADVGDFDFTGEKYLLYMMVHKNVITDCAMKVEGGGFDPIELKVPNTVTDEWEVLEFDFTDAIGQTRTRLVVFPDFPEARTEGSTCYVDNFAYEDLSAGVSIKRVNNTFISIFPNPASEMITVQYPGMRSITISNIVGQTVRTVVSESNYIQRVPISDLKSGVYFVTLDTPDGLVSSKFVKQ